MKNTIAGHSLSLNRVVHKVVLFKTMRNDSSGP